MATFQKIIRILYNRSGLIDADQVNIACNLLNKSGVIALPTDTLYGIAAKADDSRALERIYSIKGRSKSKPLAICVATVDQIENVADIGNVSMNLLKNLLPGPVTIVLKRAKGLNKDLNPNMDTIGVRVPDHNFIMALSSVIGPLALTSANRSGEKNSIMVEDFKELWDDLDAIFDAGPIKTFHIKELEVMKKNKLGSTVIDLTDDEKKIYKIIREGHGFNRIINILTRFGYLKKQ